MKILFITSRFPFPLEKGDKLRAFELIKNLSAHHQIILFAINETVVTDSQLAQLKPYCEKIYTEQISKFNSYFNLLKNILGYLPFSVAYFLRKTVCQRIKAIATEEKPDHIFCHLIRMSEYVKDINIPKTLDYMDTFSMGMERMLENESGLKKIAIAIEHKRLLRYESQIYNCFDKHIIISDQDRSHIPHPDRDKIEVIPNGVDFDFFYPQQLGKKYDVLFAGNMNYPPNIESVLFLANEIWPLVLKQKPDAKLLIAGASPTLAIKQLQSNSITVSGWVDDIRTSFAHSKIMIAPMLISIGLQNKILQAMAMKVPCIVSSLANNAVGAKHNQEVLIAATAAEYASCIISLLSDETQSQTIAENAYTFVKQNFNWQVQTQRLEQYMIAS
ncbi:MAG: glycosyltransferase [Bacteroidia bacterium]|nr:glycosyltransferase [Bacteroidia bacterium]